MTTSLSPLPITPSVAAGPPGTRPAVSDASASERMARPAASGARRHAAPITPPGSALWKTRHTARAAQYARGREGDVPVTTKPSSSGPQPDCPASNMIPTPFSAGDCVQETARVSGGAKAVHGVRPPAACGRSHAGGHTDLERLLRHPRAAAAHAWAAARTFSAPGAPCMSQGFSVLSRFRGVPRARPPPATVGESAWVPRRRPSRADVQQSNIRRCGRARPSLGSAPRKCSEGKKKWIPPVRGATFLDSRHEGAGLIVRTERA